MTLKLNVAASIVGYITGANDIAEVTANLDKKKIIPFTTGVAADQANLLFSDHRSIAASSNEDLDLAGGLSDPLGAVLTFARIKAIMIVADAANVNNVVVGGAATNTFVGPFSDATDKVALPPGGMLLVAAPTAAGWPVTATTADLFRVANSGAGSAVGYDIVLLGGAT